MDYKDKYLKYKSKYMELKLIKQNGGTGSKAKIILFKADWCGHCQNFLPKWEKLQNKYKNKYNFETYDSDKNQDIANKYKIQGYPTLYIEKNNKSKEYNGKREETEIINAVNKL